MPELADAPVVLVWKDRAVKVLDGLLWMSRVGDHDDWGIFPYEFSPEGAFALGLGLGTKILSVSLIDEDRLRIEKTGGKRGHYVLDGNPCYDGRLYFVEE